MGSRHSLASFDVFFSHFLHTILHSSVVRLGRGARSEGAGRWMEAAKAARADRRGVSERTTPTSRPRERAVLFPEGSTRTPDRRQGAVRVPKGEAGVDVRGSRLSSGLTDQRARSGPGRPSPSTIISPSRGSTPPRPIKEQS